VTWTLTIGYTAVAIIAAIVVFVLSARLGDERRPTGQRIVLSVAAGAVWPVILVGLAEVGSFAMYAKAYAHDDEDDRVLVVV
jgi:hypothetical protein